MLRSRIIPVLLIKDGGLVKSINFGDYKYVGDPINAVKIFNEKEVDELVIYDIDASVNKCVPNFDYLKQIARQSRMPLCYGGGIRSAESAAKIISLGFEKVSLSSIIFEDEKIVSKTSKLVGSQSVVATLDIKLNKFTKNYNIYTHNAKTKQKQSLLDICKKLEDMGVGEIVLNSIDRDGTYSGYDLRLAKSVRSVVTVPLTILGGCQTVAHMEELIHEIGVVGAAAGSMFVFNGRLRAVLISYSRPHTLM